MLVQFFFVLFLVRLDLDVTQWWEEILQILSLVLSFIPYTDQISFISCWISQNVISGWPKEHHPAQQTDVKIKKELGRK